MPELNERLNAYYAHSDTSVGQHEWHQLSVHLTETGRRAAEYLKFVDGCADIARTAGLLHDVGKYTKEFQARLQGDVNRVDHSTAGAQIAIDRYNSEMGKVLAFCIAGHHAGLADGVGDGRSLEKRIKKKGISDPDPIWKSEIALPGLDRPPHITFRDENTYAFSVSFFVRMVFSALVDADRIDTENWYNRRISAIPKLVQYPQLDELQKRLDAYLAEFMDAVDGSALNRLRQKILLTVRSKSELPQGLFTLTVPTGGGKTLTSLAFALDHAIRHDLARVIYVIPFTSIIEQTVTVFRNALRAGSDDEAEFVVEHHSVFDEEKIRNREARDKLHLAMENWDAPIIVTTAVQFFESLFSNRPSSCRKLHNIGNSVVILDEAQTLPLKFLRPCVVALDELARNWKASIVLCTATQPALASSKGFRGGFENLEELAPDVKGLAQTLKRTSLFTKGKMSDAELAEQLQKTPQVLCIVNTRQHAYELYEKLKSEGIEEAYYLTTLMCARHRRERLNMLQKRLKAGRPVCLVATSLIEAGVYIDFPVVWRAETGLESIIQAAGRCNREGKRVSGDVFVFEPVHDDGRIRKPPLEIGQLADVARRVMQSSTDLHTLSVIESYFREVYWIRENDLDSKEILQKLHERRSNLDFPFETIAKKFKLIETDMVPVIVRYRSESESDEMGTVDDLLDQLQSVQSPGKIARRLQPYVVQIPPDVRNTLCNIDCGNGPVVKFVRKEDFAEQFAVLTNLDFYSEDVGLVWKNPKFLNATSLIV